MQILEIKEIRSVAAQGVTRPVFCVGADDRTYVVKGAFAGKQSLVNEWVASRLGQFVGLPIPYCAQLQVLPDMFAYSAQKEELLLLGRETLFGSLWQKEMVELRVGDLSHVDIELRAKILAFDHWIGNGDRTLSAHGGNPNLLWSPSESRLAVIDHNLAFDFNDPDGNFSNHVFIQAKAAWSSSFKQEMEGLFAHAIGEFDGIFRELPTDWLDAGGEEIYEQIKASQSRFQIDPDIFLS